MTPTGKIQRRRREVRERMVAISRLEGDTYTDEVQTEERSLQDELITLDRREETAKVAEEQEAEGRAAEAKKGSAEGLDAETRERIELRSKAMLSNYLSAAARGRMVDGAEAELSSAAGVGGIPLELWDVPVEQRQGEERAITPAPGTVGVNLDPIRPAIFANSIAMRLGVDMPRVMSGTYATGTITTSQDAAALAKSGPAVGAVGAITVTMATPKRISARLELSLEDIAAVGQANFEAILRQNLALALSDELDDQAINGGGVAPALTGMFERLADPAAAPAQVSAFDDFASAHAGGVDGLWANTIKDVGIVCGPATYRLASRTFQTAANYKGELSAAAYAMENAGGLWTNKRMPDAATFETVDNVQQAILYRKGRSAMGASAGMRTAVCPHWGEVGIDDIYSGSASGERYFTLHVLLGRRDPRTARRLCANRLPGGINPGGGHGPVDGLRSELERRSGFRAHRDAACSG